MRTPDIRVFRRLLGPKRVEVTGGWRKLLNDEFLLGVGTWYIGHYMAYCTSHQPRRMDDDECGTVGGMIGSGNRSTRRKLAPLLSCPQEISHDLTRTRNRPTAVEEIS
jgi:hypothetical protein